MAAWLSKGSVKKENEAVKQEPKASAKKEVKQEPELSGEQKVKVEPTL